MTTNSNKYDLVKEKIKSFEDEKTEGERIEEDAFILMANYLSEIERFQNARNLKRKDLAEMIGTSASYLTQVFRGDKPLNFITIAKIRKALGLVFTVKAYPIESYKRLNIYTNVENASGCDFKGDYSGLVPVTSSIGTWNHQTITINELSYFRKYG